jgi:hypothetical protein
MSSAFLRIISPKTGNVHKDSRGRGFKNSSGKGILHIFIIYKPAERADSAIVAYPAFVALVTTVE